MRPTRNFGLETQWNSITESDFSFASNWQVVIASWWSMADCVSPLIWLEHVQNRGCHSIVNSNVHPSFLSRGSFFLICFIHKGSYNLSASLTYSSLSPERRGLVKTSPVRLCFPWSLTLWPLSSCSSLHSCPSTAEGSFYGDGWVRHLSMGITECS